MNTTELINKVESVYLKKGLPAFRPGDTLKVHVKVVEGESERIQAFEGVVIRKQGGGLSETFTVRKTSFGIGVERTFPVHSPRIDKIELVKSGKSRRAKLFYLRKLSGKAARLVDREQDNQVSSRADTASQTPAAAPVETKAEPQKKKSAPEPAAAH